MPMPNAIVATMIEPVLAQEPRLVAPTRPRVEPGVVRQRGEPLRDQEVRRLVHRGPGQAVDDAGLARVLGAQQPEQLAPRLVLRLDPVLDVGPVEARHELARAAQRQTAPRSPRASARVAVAVTAIRGTRGPPLVQHRQAQVVGPEVVPPLGHAVRLVDGEQRDGAAVEQLQGGLGAQPLRGQVEQVELAVHEGVLDAAPRIGVLGRVEEAGRARPARSARPPGPA